MKPSSDLKNNPVFSSKKESPEAPVKSVVDKLTVTDGANLDILTRSNIHLAKAKEMAYIYEFLYDSKFVSGYVKTIELMAISAGGQARTELIDALQAGGHLPPEYYAGKKKGSDMLFVKEEE